jgi:predicted metal-dependent enzyme (double-stranded beta helix superfamily)
MATDLGRVLAGVMGDDEFARVMERFARTFAEYRDRLPSIPHAYSRTRLAIVPEYEIVAMSWAPQSISPIHDHGVSRCWVLMLYGTLDVRNFECDPSVAGNVSIREAEHLQLRAGDIDGRLGPTELHRVVNPSKSHSAYSLQLYSRPLTTYSVVDLHSGQRRAVSATCELDLTLESGFTTTRR